VCLVEEVDELAKLGDAPKQSFPVLALKLSDSQVGALETRHFINGGRTIEVEQQVKKDCPKSDDQLKTPAAYREIDVHPDVAAYLQKFVSGKSGLVLRTESILV
jgi:hypothetical protein